MLATMSIYVGILVRGEMDEIWKKTQTPQLHQRWDLRFSDIEYLPREPGEPQNFLYATRIGASLRIEGAGESVGEHEAATGQRTSALKFWSKDPKSLIEFGSGYWKYSPCVGGIGFVTSYDYRTRFGVVGKIVDRLAFRRLLGWATAWSFDRLRLWIESDIPPEQSLDRFVVYGLARFTVAFVWLYHGLVPKLLYRSPDEMKLLSEAGVAANHLARVSTVLGWAEVAMAVIMLALWRSRWPLWATLIAMVAALCGVAAASPAYLSAAFNPVTLNVSVFALAAVALRVGTSVPSARNCRRKPQEPNHALDL